MSGQNTYRDLERGVGGAPTGQERSFRLNSHVADNKNAASNEDDDQSIQIGHIGMQPAKYRHMNSENVPQPDYYNWSTASLFLCFVWGLFAFRASERVRKFNRLREYNHAAYHSAEALRRLLFFFSFLFLFVYLHLCIINKPLIVYFI